jgi:hypothetical protein
MQLFNINLIRTITVFLIVMMMIMINDVMKFESEEFQEDGLQIDFIVYLLVFDLLSLSSLIQNCRNDNI